MKNSKLLAALGILLTLVGFSASAGKLQNSDFATPQQIVSAGGNISQLLNDSNIYVTSLGVSLSAAIAGGALGGTNLDSTFNVKNVLDYTKQWRVSLTAQATGVGTTFVYQSTQDRHFIFPDDSTTVVGTGTPQTLEQKTIDADKNYISNIRNANIAPDAGIVPSKIAGGTANSLPTWNAQGVLSDGMPGMAISALDGTFGFASGQTLDVPVEVNPVTGKLNTFELEIAPTNPSDQLNMNALVSDVHFDRSDIGNSFNGGFTNLSLNTTHEGAGHVTNIYGLNNSLSVGVGALKSGSADQAVGLNIGSSVNDTYTLGNYAAVNHGLTVVTGGHLNNFDGFITNTSGDVTGNYRGSVVSHNGLIGGGFTGSSVGTAGTVTGNYVGFNNQHTGDVLGGFTGVLIGQNGGTLNGQVQGVSINFDSAADSTSKTAHNIVMGGGDSTGGGRFMEANFQNGNYTNKIGINAIMGSGHSTASDTGFNADFGSSTTDGNQTGVNVNQNTAVSEDFAGMTINASGTGNRSITGININGSGYAGQSVVGLSIDVGGITTNAPRKVAATINGGILNTAVFVTTTAGTLIDSVNTNFTQVNILNGQAITGTDILMRNLSGTISAGDDFTQGPLGLGISSVGFVSQVGVAANHTVDMVQGVLGAVALAPGANNGGQLSDGAAFRSAGLFPFGGTTTVTNFASFDVMATSCAGGATNCWGVNVRDTSATNSFSRNVVVGSATGLATNASVGAEIAGTTKALLLSRLTTGQQNALTAVDGMQVYNTSLGKPQCYSAGSWQDCAPSGSAGGSTINITADPIIGGVTSGGVQMLSSAVGVTLTSIQGIPPYLVRDTVNFVNAADSNGGTSNLVSRNAQGDSQFRKVTVTASVDLLDPAPGANRISLAAPSGLAASYSFTLPVDDGLANQVLATDGAGVTSWVAQSSSTGAITTLTGDVSTDPAVAGIAASHVNMINGFTALQVAESTSLIATATPLISTSTIVSRNGFGDFAARIITADLVGNVTGSATTLTSVLDVSHGGTGGNTTQTAMATLLPLNQKGDLLVYNGSQFDRLPVGTAGQVLTAAPVTTTAGIYWSNGGGGGGGGSSQVSEYAIFGSPGVTFGITNTAVFRFNDTAVTIDTGGGADFQCQDDALLGFYCNIFTDGVYFVSAQVLRTDDDGYISVSASNAGIQDGSTGVGTFTTLGQKSNIRDIQRGIRTAGAPQEVSTNTILKAGDTVWCGGDGVGSYSSDYTTWRFHITKVGN